MKIYKEAKRIKDFHYNNILAWIGSKHFNRSIRLYSENELAYILTSHGIFDYKNVIAFYIYLWQYCKNGVGYFHST